MHLPARLSMSSFILAFIIALEITFTYGHGHGLVSRAAKPTKIPSETLSTLDVTATTTSTVRKLDDSDTFSGNPATIPTPRTTTFATKPVALFVPQVDPKVEPGPYQVQYLGPGNALATVYQVVFSSQGQASPLTATLIEDSTMAELFGAQQVTVLSGDDTSTTIWAAATCNYPQGIGPTPAAASCVYFNKVGPVSSKWLTAE